MKEEERDECPVLFDQFVLASIMFDKSEKRRKEKRKK